MGNEIPEEALAEIARTGVWVSPDGKRVIGGFPLAVDGGEDTDAPETPAERGSTPLRATNYHATVTDFRRELATSAEGWNKASEHYLKLMHAQPRAETPAEVRDAYAGTLMAYSYSYTLAAVLGIAERELGMKAAERLAFEADEILTNGDFDDLNADVMPAQDTEAAK